MIVPTFNYNDYFDLPIALPSDCKTSVRIETVDKEVAIFFNDSIVHLTAVKGIRYSGNVTVFTSSPYYPAALASISAINLTSISSITGYGQNLADFNGSISEGALIEKTFVPANYSLTFDIIPTGLGSRNTLSSIVHFTQDYLNSGPRRQIPGMLQFVQPISYHQIYNRIALFLNSTQLYVGISTSRNSNENFDAPGLPLNQQTNIRVEAVGREVFVFYNSSLSHFTMYAEKGFQEMQQ